MASQPRVALLGLGAMGSRMALRLLGGGWPLAVFDVRPEAAGPATAAGARFNATPREATRGADFAILMVRDFAQAEQALGGPDGALAGFEAGATLLVMSTIAPRQARLIEERAGERGVEVLDAPVSGGTPGAESGTLSVMIGGPAERVERCRPLLERLGERLYHVGPNVGDGQSGKMVNQLLCGVHLVAAAEALTLARKAGLDQATMLDLVSHSAASSWMLQHRAGRMVERRFGELHSALALLLKDMGIVLDGAAAVDAPTPLAAAARELYKAGAAMGLGDRDDSTLIQVYERMAGL
jgi:3-hydroxyisobutyrate dehydrogenase